MKSISAKKLKKLGGKMPFSTITKRTKPKRGKAAVVRRRRTKREFARIYGSKARVEFVKSLPCAACGVVGYSENAHLLGNGGMSRKTGYETVGPLCGPHLGNKDTGFIHVPRFFVGCHTMYDEYQELFNRQWPDFDPEKVARETEELFRASLGSATGGQT